MRVSHLVLLLLCAALLTACAQQPSSGGDSAGGPHATIELVQEGEAARIAVSVTGLAPDERVQAVELIGPGGRGAAAPLVTTEGEQSSGGVSGQPSVGVGVGGGSSGHVGAGVGLGWTFGSAGSAAKEGERVARASVPIADYPFYASTVDNWRLAIRFVDADGQTRTAFIPAPAD